MEKKDSKFKWNKKNNGTVFGLCLVGVAAFSVLFATGQVKQAQKEKEELVNEQAALENSALEDGDDSFVPQVDEAMENALDQTAGILDAAESLDEMSGQLEATSGGLLTEEGTEGETDLAGEAAAQIANASGVADTVDVDGAQVSSSSVAAADQISGVSDVSAAQEVGLTGEGITAQSGTLLPTVSFDEADSLSWPVAGNVVLDYSMDGSIYFPTLQQYKYNPALVIGSDEGAQVVASAKGIVESIEIDEETGNTVTMSLGNGYKLKYGQLQELTVAEGDVVNEGQLIGYVSQPTKYYCKEGSNLYFAMTKDEVPVDPVLYLE